MIAEDLLLGEAGACARKQDNGMRSIDPEVVDGEMACITCVEAEAEVLGRGDIAVGVGEQEELLLAGYEGAADVLDKAEDIGDVLPGLVGLLRRVWLWLQQW